MTSPNTDRPSGGRRFWKIAAITLGAGTLVIGTVAAVSTWIFINHGLTPLLERRLSKLLERELELGELQGLSWNGLRVGPSKLNATEIDPTYVTAEAVEVGFTPLRLLLTRELEIDLRLIGAEGYVEQHPEEGWLGIDVPTFEPPPEEPPIKVRLEGLEIVDSQLILVPLPADGTEPTPLQLTDLAGSVDIEPTDVNGQDAQRVEFEAIATSPQGGDLDITGAVVPVASDNKDRPIQQEITLAVGAEGVAAQTGLAFLLPTLGQQNLPIAATAGRVSGQWTVSFVPDRPITVDGAGSVNQAQLQLTALPSEGSWGNTVEDIDATARFNGTTITVDQAAGSYANIPVTATGTLDWNGDYDLTANVVDVELEQLLEQADVAVPIPLIGVFNSQVAVTGPMLNPRLVADVAATGPVTIDRVILSALDAEVVLASDRIANLFDAITVTQVNAVPELGGQVTGSGVINLANLPDGPPELDFTAQATNVSGDAIAALYDVQALPVTLGAVNATATLIGAPATLRTQVDVQAPTLVYGNQMYPATATAIFADGGLSIPQASVQVGSGTLTGNGKAGTDSWQAALTASNIDLQMLGLAAAPAGTLNADVALAGPLQGASLQNLLAIGDYDVQLANGAVQGDIELRQGGWQTSANLNALELSQFSPQLRGSTSGVVTVAGQLDTFTLAALRGRGNLTFSAGLAGLSPQLAGFDTPLTSQFAWTGRELLIEQASSAQLQARGVVSPELDGNQFRGIRGFSLDLDAERYPLALLPSPVPLDGLASFEGRLAGTPSSPQLNGRLQLEEFAVNQVAFDPSLSGTVSYQSQAGLALDLVGQGGPSTQVPDNIAINFQNPRNFDFDVRWQGAQATGRADGDVLRTSLQDLQLAALGLPAVTQLGGAPQGLLSSQGEWVFDLNQPTLTNAGIIVENPQFGYVTAQKLTAQLSYSNQELTVNNGKLQLNPFTEFGEIDERFFLACPSLVKPSVEGDALSAEPSGDPIPETVLQTVPQAASSEYAFGGKVNLSNFAYEADVNVTQGNIRHVMTALAITELQDLLQLFQSSEQLENRGLGDAVSGILTAQSVGSFDDAENPLTFDLQNRLLRLSEICALQEQELLAKAEELIPALEQLQGMFDAAISISGRPQEIPQMMFALDGQAWSWGPDFVADRVVAEGQLVDGNLTLQPVRLETALSPLPDGTPQVAFVNLAGNLSLVDQESSGLQLVAEQLPVAAVRDIFNLPLGLQGRIDAIANFSGSIGNPIVRGEVELADGSINSQPIDKAEGLFLYDNARLTLQGELLQVDNPEPLTIFGDIPYAFDFMTVQPADDSIDLTIDVADEGLALLNVLNNQVSWESGKGRVSLNVGGRLRQLTITGEMNVREAVLRSPLLPDPLTDFSGQVVFNDDQIIVESLQGNYGEGQIQATGRFPLGLPYTIDPPELALLGGTADENEPPESETETDGPFPIPPNDDALNPIPMHPTGALTVTLRDVDLDLRGIYQGGVNGQVVVGGSLLLGGPQLGGVVELANGRLFLPEGGGNPSEPAPTEISPFVPRFENLKLTLARNIQIQQSNLLNVVAQGDLQVSGPLRPFRAIQPEGLIRLRSGRINLLTTTFRLAGRDNVARFFPDRGIADPLLDLQLRTSVTETQQSNVIEASAFASSEIADASIDPFRGTTGLETIRIRATYQGTASNLLDSLFLSDIGNAVIELSSSPPRSRQEIINLLSGSYVAALQSGQGVLNFFGGALLNSIQDFVGRTLNLSEFRLFPVTSASQFSSEENSGSSLDVATEIGFDVTNNLTLSLVKILTDSTPTEFNLRYRLTDEFTIRSTTNFDDRNRILLEFETRF